MKIINNLIISTAIFLLLGATACQQTGNKNVAVNQPANNTANAENKSNGNQPVANKPETSSTSLATPTDAYKAFYSARQKKDIEALKKVMSKDALDFFTEISKIDNKTLDDALKQLADKPQAATAETRNEKIDGDKATLEFLDEKGGWSPMDFLKEGNDWKLTIPKLDEPPKTGDKTKKQM